MDMPYADQHQRYARQRIFPPIGATGQARLANARVAIVGCGALGTHLADALARAGVGRLIIIDRDIVEWSNLQRQILFDEADARAGTPKALAAGARLRQVNAAIIVEPRVLDLDAEAARDLTGEVDLILDGTDAFETRYIINDACVAAGIPWIYSAVVGAEGMTMNCHVADPTDAAVYTPCLRCVWPEPAPPGSAATCDTAGVINGAVSVVTGLAATEALKILVGSDAVNHDLRSFDLWSGTFESITLPRDADCPACVRHQFDWLDAAELQATTHLCGRDTVQVRPEHPTRQTMRVNLADLLVRWQTAGLSTHAGENAFARLQLDGVDLTVFPDGRALIRGVSDLAQARTLYARYVGM